MNGKSKSGRPTEETVKAYESVVTAGKENLEKAVRAGSDAAAQAMQMNKQGLEAAVKGFDDISKQSRRTLEALMNAGTVTTRGLETINAENMAFAKTQFDESVAAAKAMFGARTLQDLIDLQTGYAKTAFDAYMSQSTKVSEIATKLAQEAFEPINAQVQAAMERAVKPMAF